jgi:hypothetical protein
MLETICDTDFRPHLHTQFQLIPVMWGDQYIPDFHGPLRSLELIEVERWGAAPKDGRQPFSLIFCEQSDTILMQQIYAITHPVLGELEIFLVPLGPKPQGNLYQAVFS